MSYFTALLAGTFALGFVMNPGFADEKVPLSEVPAAAVDAVKKKFPGAEIRDKVEKETKKDGVFYEFELLKDGKKIEAEVSPEGQFREIETELTAADLPQAVADAVAERFPDHQLKKAKEEIKFSADQQETKVYEIDIVSGGKEHEVKVDPDGKILKVKED